MTHGLAVTQAPAEMIAILPPELGNVRAKPGTENERLSPPFEELTDARELVASVAAVGRMAAVTKVGHVDALET